MSALSDPNSVNLTRDPVRDGDVRDEAWWQELTGLRRDNERDQQRDDPAE